MVGKPPRTILSIGISIPGKRIVSGKIPPSFPAEPFHPSSQHVFRQSSACRPDWAAYTSMSPVIQQIFADSRSASLKESNGQRRSSQLRCDTPTRGNHGAFHCYVLAFQHSYQTTPVSHYHSFVDLAADSIRPALGVNWIVASSQSWWVMTKSGNRTK